MLIPMSWKEHMKHLKDLEYRQLWMQFMNKIGENIMNNEMYRVLYKGINGGFQLSDDMDFDAACQFRNKCLNIGYDTAYVIQIVE